MSNFYVYLVIEGFLLQFVVVNYVIWDELEGHSHVLVLIERCFEINVFDVGTTKFGSWGTDDTVL